jgi:hypothetical protein
MRATRPVLPMTGGCACGTIRYEITSFPLLLYSCHCTDCQTISGSAFALNMPVATTGFRIVTGRPKAWRRLSPSGAEVLSWFCGDCGGRLYGERLSRPESMTIRAGTLDDTAWLVPSAHMFMKSAQPWIQAWVQPGLSPATSAECHETSPPDFRPLARKWRALWPEFFSPE